MGWVHREADDGCVLGIQTTVYEVYARRGAVPDHLFFLFLFASARLFFLVSYKYHMLYVVEKRWRFQLRGDGRLSIFFFLAFLVGIQYVLSFGMVLCNYLSV